MERVRLVCFYVAMDERGSRLEVSVRTDKRQVRNQKYENMTIPEMLCVVEAEMDHMRPGDLVDENGTIQPPLWR